jgi:hypothetical protein
MNSACLPASSGLPVPGSPPAMAADMRDVHLVKIYCESGALTDRVRELGCSGHVELLHFPYDPASHSRKFSCVAAPSHAQIRDLNLPISDLPDTLAGYLGSCHLDEILSILGSDNPRDALHVDSAFKSGCAAFVTPDKHHILENRTHLESLLGIKFFHPIDDISDLEHFVADAPRAPRMC